MTLGLHFIVPGPLDQLTGGYVYDAHMVRGLEGLGWSVRLHNLPGRFPEGDDAAREALSVALGSFGDDERVVIDGLAMGGIPEAVELHGRRLRIVSLVHHPLAEETGLATSDRLRYADSERRALAPCAGVIVSSAFIARGLDAYGVSPERIRVVEPGTDPARPAVGPGPNEPPLLLCVASVTPRKGHDVLVAALARLQGLDWNCVCAGSLDRDRAFAKSVLDGAQQAGLATRVSFVGEREGEQLEALYQGASLFVLASHYEGYGMVLTDAIARGLPVVSTTGGAIPFTVPAAASVLAAPGDAAAFASALRSVLGGASPRRAELAAAALRHAGRLPNWGAASRTFADAIIELTR